jgi:hypothetical protein
MRFEGRYMSEDTQLDITAANHGYAIEFSSDNGASGCEFQGMGTVKNGILIVPIKKWKKSTVMTLQPRSGALLDVFTGDFKDRFVLRYFCRGGASLAGGYIRQEIPTSLRGYYTWGYEVESLRLCNSKKTYWIYGTEALLKPLRNKSWELAKKRVEPYQPVYVEITATWEGKATKGLAANYEGVYRIRSIETIRESGPDLCLPPD